MVAVLQVPIQRVLGLHRAHLVPQPPQVPVCHFLQRLGLGSVSSWQKSPGDTSALTAAARIWWHSMITQHSIRQQRSFMLQSRPVILHRTSPVKCLSGISCSDWCGVYAFATIMSW